MAGRSTETSDELGRLKSELERFGAANDAATPDRPGRMLNITRDTGEFLAVLVHATAATRVLEIGTSNGYSTLWLAEAVSARSGVVTTLESAAYKAGLAHATFARSGLQTHISLVHGDAGRFLGSCDSSAYDLIFLDANRQDYPDWWPELRRILRPGGLLIVDNATSHVDEMAPLVSLVAADRDFTTCLVPVGNGEFVAVRSTGPGGRG